MIKFLVRLLISLLVFAVFDTMPLYFLLNYFKDGYQRIFCVLCMTFVSAVTSMILVYMYNRIITKPVTFINNEVRGLISGGYKSRIEYKTSNKTVMGLINNINSIAVEFENIEEMRKSFVASASHELRSPLASIQGFLQALLEGLIDNEKDKQKYLKLVYDESKRLSEIINSMLDLSRLESGKYPLYKVKFDINNLIKQVNEKFKPMLLKNDTVIETMFIKDPLFVYADKGKIEQVLINLLDNAIKYSPPFSKININTYIQSKKIYILVRDRGFGISKKDQMFIWDKFFRVDKARTPSKSKGTGLGLSIVKKIMDDHREIVWVESNKGEGAKFCFTLPVFDPNKHSVFGATISYKPVDTAGQKGYKSNNTENYRWGL